MSNQPCNALSFEGAKPTCPKIRHVVQYSNDGWRLRIGTRRFHRVEGAPWCLFSVLWQVAWVACVAWVCPILLIASYCILLLRPSRSWRLHQRRWHSYRRCAALWASTSSMLWYALFLSLFLSARISWRVPSRQAFDVFRLQYRSQRWSLPQGFDSSAGHVTSWDEAWHVATCLTCLVQLLAVAWDRFFPSQRILPNTV